MGDDLFRGPAVRVLGALAGMLGGAIAGTVLLVLAIMVSGSTLGLNNSSRCSHRGSSWPGVWLLHSPACTQGAVRDNVLVLTCRPEYGDALNLFNLRSLIQHQVF